MRSAATPGQFYDPIHYRGPLGLAGDEQADLSVHGGLSKAVYAYPKAHYAFWQTVRAQARVSLWDEPLPPGALGENVVETHVSLFDGSIQGLARVDRPAFCFQGHPEASPASPARQSKNRQTHLVYRRDRVEGKQRHCFVDHVRPL